MNRSSHDPGGRETAGDLSEQSPVLATSPEPAGQAAAADPDLHQSKPSRQPGSGPLTLTVPSSSHGRRLVRFLLESIPGLGSGAIYKSLEKRDIRLNGQRLRRDVTLAAGDQVSVFLPDIHAKTVQPIKKQPSTYRLLQQVGGVMIIIKQPGLAVQPGQDLDDREETLISLLRRDLNQPAVELCHRIDRQTGGLLLAAANAEIAGKVRQLMQEHLIHKRYRCLVRGIPDEGDPVATADGVMMKEIVAWHEKDAARSDVYIHDIKQPGDVPVTTRYRVLRLFPEAGPDQEAVSELEVELVTGRTHQIRAHFAHLGHPLLGDGKYGRNAYNRYFRTATDGSLKRQQLWATSIFFDPDCQSPCTALAGRTISIDPVYDVVLAGKDGVMLAGQEDAGFDGQDDAGLAGQDQ